MSAVLTNLGRAEVEDFLFEEADLLDSWKLNEWLALFTNDGTYCVPSLDLPEGASPDDSLFIIADDHPRLEQRVIRMLKKTDHSEWPRSRTRHLVSNVRVVARSDEGLSVTSAFATFRSKNGVTDTFVGTAKYRLREDGGTFRIAAKTAYLDMDALRPHGRVSILL